MGMTDSLKGHEPRDNDAKPNLAGEFVAIVKELKKINSKKTGKDYLILNCEIINVVSAKDGNQAVVGDDISQIYTCDDEKSMKRFSNDMFTSEINLDYSSDEALENSFGNVVNQKVLFRCWMYERKDGNGKAQSTAIKNKKGLKAEQLQAEIPF